MNLSGLSNSQIEQAIEKMQKGIEIKPNSPEAVELQTSIDRALEELQRRAQKKSVEPSANQGQLQRTPIRDAAAKVPQEIKDEVEAWAEKVEREANEPEKAFDLGVTAKVEHINEAHLMYTNSIKVIGIVTAAPVITVPVVEIALSSGTKQMNRTEIMTMLKTWFKRVATSKAMEEGRFSDAYGGAMGQDTYKLFQGWNVIYTETQEGAAWPPLTDVFPGLARASQQQKVNAEILWRWASNEK